MRHHHHLDGETVGILVAVSLGLPTLWVAWAAYRGPRRGSTPVSGLSMTQVADQLAVAVGAQWNAEAAARRLNDPYPLPVSWTAADPSLTDTWDSIGELATRPKFGLEELDGLGLRGGGRGPRDRPPWLGRAARW